MFLCCSKSNEWRCCTQSLYKHFYFEDCYHPMPNTYKFNSETLIDGESLQHLMWRIGQICYNRNEGLQMSGCARFWSRKVLVLIKAWGIWNHNLARILSIVYLKICISSHALRRLRRHSRQGLMECNQRSQSTDVWDYPTQILMDRLWGVDCRSHSKAWIEVTTTAYTLLSLQKNMIWKKTINNRKPNAWRPYPP